MNRERPTEMELKVHDLAQHLTTLRCRLELGLLQPDEETAWAVVEGGLADMQRVFDSLTRLRESMRAAGTSTEN